MHQNTKICHPIGNWVSDFSAGKFIKANWFIPVSSFIDIHQIVRFYDLAATSEDIKRDSFYTASVKMAKRYNPHKAQDEYCIIEANWIRGDYEQVNEFMLDNAARDGINCEILFEQEPGSSGKRDAENIKDMLGKYIVEAISPQGSKLNRCKPFARTLSQGKIFIMPFLRWQEFTRQLEKFDGSRVPLVTDLADSCAGAFSYLFK